MEPSADDGLKWFGEGFDGFPKHLPDDTVEYCLFVIDEKLESIATTTARLNEILTDAKAFAAELTKDYIWQRDHFDLRLQNGRRTNSTPSPTANSVKSTDSTNPDTTPYLFGRTTFGDAIADEWLIVYILVELSKRYTDAWITVTDSDGEFLLIEAASALPKWLNPDIAANRVWISNGHLKLIPIDRRNPSHRNISRSDALYFLRTRRDELVVSQFVEDAAFARLRAYPAAIDDSLHHALITIPRRLAYVLHLDPTSISPAIEAFYMRDLVSIKPLQTKDLATLAFPPEDFVTTSVKFTKVNYAQLRSQVFEAPPAWVGIKPRLRDEKVQMGMKLSCGFEMLLADPANKNSRMTKEIRGLLRDLDDGVVQLPNDGAIATWSTRQDTEKWLDVDYADFEAEFAGKGSGNAKNKDGVRNTAQDQIRQMVDRFQQFVDDDDAGIDGVSEDGEDSDASMDSSGEDKAGSFDEAEFEQAMKEMMGMSDAQKQEACLLDEARKLARDDGEENEMDIDEETQEMMRRMEQELNGQGALVRGKKEKKEKNIQQSKKPVMFGPAPPPGFQRDRAQDGSDDDDDDEEEEEEEEEIGPGDVELSSDDEEFNDIDVNLAQNLLQSFKGQAGMSGPAGNMMKALGLTLPRDEDD